MLPLVTMIGVGRQSGKRGAGFSTSDLWACGRRTQDKHMTTRLPFANYFFYSAGRISRAERDFESAARRLSTPLSNVVRHPPFRIARSRSTASVTCRWPTSRWRISCSISWNGCSRGQNSCSGADIFDSRMLTASDAVMVVLTTVGCVESRTNAIWVTVQVAQPRLRRERNHVWAAS